MLAAIDSCFDEVERRGFFLTGLQLRHYPISSCFSLLGLQHDMADKQARDPTEDNY